MAIAEVFPYSDQHNLNLDWIIAKIKEFSGNQISGIACEQLDADTVKFVITYTDGSTKELTEITLPEGPEGPQGETGATGATPELSIGTVSTLPAGSDATVTITGTAEEPVINMGIPQGIQGETGAAGGITNINGYTGAVTTGDGIAFDNSTGKISSYDFNLTDTGVISTATGTDIDMTGGSLCKALNAEGSIGKIYGRVLMKTATTIGTAGQKYIDSGFIVEAPATQYFILTGGLALTSTFDTQRDVFIRVRTDGHVEVGIYVATTDANKTFYVYLPACIYFFKDFGDSPNANVLSMRMAAMSPDLIEDPQER